MEGSGGSAILFTSLSSCFTFVFIVTDIVWERVLEGGGGGLAPDKAGDSKQARLSTRSSLGANYISSVH